MGLPAPRITGLTGRPAPDQEGGRLGRRHFVDEAHDRLQPALAIEGAEVDAIDDRRPGLGPERPGEAEVTCLGARLWPPLWALGRGSGETLAFSARLGLLFTFVLLHELGHSLIAQAHGEIATANMLNAMAEGMGRARGDMRQQLYAGLDRAHASLRAA